MKPPREGGKRETIVLSLVVAAICIGILVAVLALVALMPGVLG